MKKSYFMPPLHYPLISKIGVGEQNRVERRNEAVCIWDNNSDAKRTVLASELAINEKSTFFDQFD